MRPVGDPPAYDVVVIGGGASGLAAAISAARQEARTCVIERDVQSGLSILATGNGRCNISNATLEPRHYRHPDVAARVLGMAPEREIAEFFESLGLMFAEEGEGRLYPVTRRAESVRDVLLAACSRAGVELHCSSEVIRAGYAGGRWSLTISEPAQPLSFKHAQDGKTELRRARKAAAEAARTERMLRAQSVIIASGGTSNNLCDLFNIPHIEANPVLCPIACELAYPNAPQLSALDGLRVEATLALVRKGAVVAYEEGEVLFRPYGISGIAAFNLSRKIEPNDSIQLDLFPALNDAQLHQLLIEREKLLGPFEDDPAWFDGLLARPLARVVCELLRPANKPLVSCASLLHRLTLHVTGTTEHAQAQVQRGGIPFEVVDLDSLALLHHEALFACGEALDMDADCGGYNLAWAWISGMCAGNAAASALAHRA
ncbi:NAD(P)/FAD-dependent oxidoreductase [Collinsella provencensis]|uniref:NAD(P)/FAD-dependent oxidoreductase n=1 Tax=Collinsella provencensis TaxID=1937461 RepID=UPI001F31B39C|nr:NAD(P)/FAD-dependent oxidoreductase [Collinsella provencensis]